MVNELTYVEAEEIVGTASAFERRNIQSKLLTVSAWYLSNFGTLSPEVWWGYKFAYYAICFPTAFSLSFAIDLLAMLTKGAAVIIKAAALKIVDFTINLCYVAASKVVGILAIAFALFLIVMFINSQGWEGMKDCYRNLIEWLKNFAE
jgi:hypothetical protein